MIIDLIIICIIAVSAIGAGKVGLIKTIYRFVSSILSLMIAYTIYPIIQEMLKFTPVYTGVQEWIANKIPTVEGTLLLQEQNSFIQEATAWLPTFVSDYLVQNNNPEVYSRLGVENLVSYITIWIADLSMMILAILISWIVVKIGVSILVTALDIISKLPVLRTVNSIAGFGVGAASGVFVVWLILAFFPVLMLIPEFTIIETWMAEATLGQFMYNHNLVLEMINGMITL